MLAIMIEEVECIETNFTPRDTRLTVCSPLATSEPESSGPRNKYLYFFKSKSIQRSVADGRKAYRRIYSGRLRRSTRNERRLYKLIGNYLRSKAYYRLDCRRARRYPRSYSSSLTQTSYNDRSTAREDNREGIKAIINKGPFTIKGQAVKPKDYIKILGVLIDARLKYKEHIARAVSKGLEIYAYKDKVIGPINRVQKIGASSARNGLVGFGVAIEKQPPRYRKLKLKTFSVTLGARSEQNPFSAELVVIAYTLNILDYTTHKQQNSGSHDKEPSITVRPGVRLPNNRNLKGYFPIKISSQDKVDNAKYRSINKRDRRTLPLSISEVDRTPDGNTTIYPYSPR
ncbi:uncharacterized protein N7482_010048 [Penicillium canariense]|uniref:Uncharacterized protein n=1 Tax=Penicillium canariense TaxID=189055 RepID=A0A9W9HRM7_9EURO|nr:uncharacterized protein N7482_010048 [Penicillium canariense]KAJ5153570.1 hypothetical protein N7482_010048 [Penicillium canariense]